MKKSPLLMKVLAIGLACCGCSKPASQTPSEPVHGILLPRERILPLNAVNEMMPEMSRELATGKDETAMGNPSGSRSVTYANADVSQRVVISVDQYGSTQDAATAYEQAFQASQRVPGAQGEPVSDLGERAFIGVVTQGHETHVGCGALYGDSIVIVTLQGYDGSTANKVKVAALIRKQAALKPMP